MTSNYSTNPVDVNTYVVAEGDVYPIESAPNYLNENGWLSDWIFVSAESPEKALEVAQKVDSAWVNRRGRVFSKLCRLLEVQNNLLSENKEWRSPLEIYNVVSSCVFNQSYVLGAPRNNG